LLRAVSGGGGGLTVSGFGSSDADADAAAASRDRPSIAIPPARSPREMASRLLAFMESSRGMDRSTATLPEA
jgi:hypothetical protein